MKLEISDKKYLLNTYAKNYTNFKYGKGATLFDDKGRDFIDFTSGIAVSSVGYKNDRLTKAISKQVENIIHISNLFVIEPQVKLAEKMVKLSGYNDMGVFFANSGAEANEGAIKIARKYGEVDGKPKRYKIITLENSFHGRTITTVKATGQEKMHNYFGPFPDGFSYAKNIDDIKNKIDNHTVAVMIELVQGEGGIEPLDKKKVQKLAKLLKKRDILLIVDEVQSGIFRTGEFLASNLYNIKPDIITMAKGLAGGVPIGAVMTNKKDVLKAGDHGSTFGGNYLSTISALTVLDILNDEKESKNLDKTIIYFNKELKKLFNNFKNLFTEEVGIGLMKGLRAKNSDIQTEVITKAFKNGLIIIKSGKNTVRFLPPLTITKQEIKEGFKRLNKTCSNIKY